jgi:hypothetical protein
MVRSAAKLRVSNQAIMDRASIETRANGALLGMRRQAVSSAHARL